MMFGYYPYWFVFITAFLMVNESNAQIPVTVTFDPPSPVPLGVTIFRCEFNITAGEALAAQYWAITGGFRFFEYQPGSEPVIDPGYENKIVGYQTDDTTYLEIYFNVTTCDMEQYLCNVLVVPSTEEGEDRASLVVENLVSPTLKYGDEIIETDTTILHSAPETVSCELYNAGPPPAESLALIITEGDGGSGVATNETERDDASCTWSYPEPLQFDVIDLTETTTFQCIVSYRDTGTLESPVLTLLDNIAALNP